MSTETLTGWIATAGQIVGNAEAWETLYDWDYRTVYATKVQAKRAALRFYGHDDFNLGQVKDGVLVWWGWMDDSLEEDIPETAEALGLASGTVKA